MSILSSDLTWIILLPVIGALAVYVTPVRTARWMALLFSALTLVLSLNIFVTILMAGHGFGDLNHLPDAINVPWINFAVGATQFKVNYSLGVLWSF
jgi:NADH-quinone oxidoreductase subunit M